MMWAIKAGPLSESTAVGNPYLGMTSSSFLLLFWLFLFLWGKASVQPEKVSTKMRGYLYLNFPGLTSVKPTSQCAPGSIRHSRFPGCGFKCGPGLVT